ncbi:hypothetical protein Q7A53_05440 [Halobacillus rhizosphaerae]|uniref:hypothetical protein n=1 Tax=Halobacillus rhizosphaerae TaxID=3064889 RepID=UPI00398BAC71
MITDILLGFMGVVGNVIGFAVAVVVVFVLTNVTWKFVSVCWKMVDEKSYEKFVDKFRALKKRKNTKNLPKETKVLSNKETKKVLDKDV